MSEAAWTDEDVTHENHIYAFRLYYGLRRAKAAAAARSSSSYAMTMMGAFELSLRDVMYKGQRMCSLVYSMQPSIASSQNIFTG